MASLPSNSFMFNYNAKEYDAVTHTFPKTQGQLFNEDLVLNKAPASYSSDYVDFGNTGAWMGKDFGSNAANPFNRDSSNNSITIIYKTSGFTNTTDNLLGNRYNYSASNYNWFLRGGYFFGVLSFTPSTNPQIIMIRIYADGHAERKSIDVNGTVLQSATADTFSWGQKSRSFGFFSGQGNASTEPFKSKFYWMYLSLETLTDAEILKVVKYNEGIVDFSIEPESMSFDYTGGTSSLSITTDVGWTASTENDWLTLSSTAGTGNSTITVTATANSGIQRNGVVSVTDGSDTLTCTISQEKHPVLVPYNNLYINGNRLN